MCPLEERYKPSRHLVIDKKENGSSAVYHSFFGNLSFLNKDAVKLLGVFDKGLTIKEAAQRCKVSCRDEIFSRFLKSRFLVPSHVDELNDIIEAKNVLESKIKKGRLFKHLRFDLTSQCNFACRYCYIKRTPLNNRNFPPTPQWAVRVLDRCFELIEPNKTTFLSIRFFGGEPLLYWGRMREAVEYAVERKPSSLDLVFYVSTNGSLVNDEIVRFGSKIGMQFIVSLDGPRDIHNRMRIDSQGRGTYERVVAGIKKLREKGNVVSIAAAVGPHNAHNLKQLVDEAVDLDVDHITLDPLTYKTIGIDDRDYKRIARAILQAWEYGKQVGVELTGSWKELLKRLLSNSSPAFFCPAFGSKTCVRTNGDVYPCSVLPIRLGNIYRDRLLDIFNSSNYHSLLKRHAGNIPMCNKCEIEGICLGGCPGEAYSIYETIQAGSNCVFKKALIEHFIKKILRRRLV